MATSISSVRIRASGCAEAAMLNRVSKIGSGTLAPHAGASIRCPTSDLAGRTLISMS